MSYRVDRKKLSDDAENNTDVASSTGVGKLGRSKVGLGKLGLGKFGFGKVGRRGGKLGRGTSKSA